MPYMWIILLVAPFPFAGSWHLREQRRTYAQRRTNESRPVQRNPPAGKRRRDRGGLRHGCGGGDFECSGGVAIDLPRACPLLGKSPQTFANSTTRYRPSTIRLRLPLD